MTHDWLGEFAKRYGAGSAGSHGAALWAAEGETARVMKALADWRPAAGRAADALAGVGLLGEEALALAPGLAWPSLEAAAWAEQQGWWPEALVDAGELASFWLAERASGTGFAGGHGRGGRPTSSVASPRMRRYRVGEGWAWGPAEIRGEKVRPGTVPSGLRAVGAVPEGVRAAEARLRRRVEAAEEHQRVLDDLGHAGPVTVPGLGLAEAGPGTLSPVGPADWECAACGAVSGDKDLFRELGCGA